MNLEHCRGCSLQNLLDTDVADRLAFSIKTMDNTMDFFFIIYLFVVKQLYKFFITRFYMQPASLVCCRIEGSKKMRSKMYHLGP